MTYDIVSERTIPNSIIRILLDWGPTPNKSNYSLAISSAVKPLA